MIYFTDSVFDTVKNIGENAIAGDIHNVQDVLKRQVGLFLHCKVSKVHFSMNHILREINFGDSLSAYDILHFLKAEVHQMNKIQNP